MDGREPSPPFPDPTPYHLRNPSPLALARRGAHITRAMGPRLSPLLARRATGRRVGASELARQLRQACEELGATFVKLGQVVASSSSLFGDDMAAEFRSFLDSGPPVRLHRVHNQVEHSLGRPIGEVFQHLDEAPIGQASLAVVHRGRLHDGREVAVKVLRPGIESKVASDLTLMDQLFRGLSQALAPGLADVLVDVLGGLRRQLEEELDLRNEARVMTYFRSLPEARLPLVVVPEPHISLSGRRVLVMEYLDGIPIDDAEAAGQLGHDAIPVVEQTMRAWFVTALRGGIFHGDVHAGNILLLRDGRAGVIDWGIVGRLSPESHRLLRRFIAAAIGDEAAWGELAEHLAPQMTTADGTLAVQPDVLRSLLRDHVGAVITQPFGQFSLADLITALHTQFEPGSPPPDDGHRTRGRLRRLRAAGPNMAVMDRG